DEFWISAQNLAPVAFRGIKAGGNPVAGVALLEKSQSNGVDGENNDIRISSSILKYCQRSASQHDGVCLFSSTLKSPARLHCGTMDVSSLWRRSTREQWSHVAGRLVSI